MSYFLRDRSDGQVEIVLLRTVQVGLYPNWTAAEGARTFLKDEQPELPDDRPVNFREAKEDVADDLSGLLPAVPKPVRKSTPRQRRNLPAMVAQPKAPVRKVLAAPHQLTDEQLGQALLRIQQGEGLRDIAPDFGVSMFVLADAWESHRREMQAFMASAGQQPCRDCGRQFTPSISSPETCARCSHA